MKIKIIVIFPAAFILLAVIGCGKKLPHKTAEVKTEEPPQIEEVQPQPQPQPVQAVTNQEVPPAVNLLAAECIGYLKIGALDKEVVQILGEAEEKSGVISGQTDGAEHQTWSYQSKGIELDMVKNQSNQVIKMISIVSPCSFRTRRDIGIGSTRDDVLALYKDVIDEKAAEENLDEIVAGSADGGIVFTFADGHVVSIFLGAGTE